MTLHVRYGQGQPGPDPGPATVQGAR